jgi:hypothetical protein
VVEALFLLVVVYTRLDRMTEFPKTREESVRGLARTTVESELHLTKQSYIFLLPAPWDGHLKVELTFWWHHGEPSKPMGTLTLCFLFLPSTVSLSSQTVRPPGLCVTNNCTDRGCSRDF